jgi:hypothetical protein
MIIRRVSNGVEVLSLQRFSENCETKCINKQKSAPAIEAITGFEPQVKKQ